MIVIFYHDLSASFRSFELLNKTENMPLSIAYNSFIDSHSNAQNMFSSMMTLR